MSVPPRPLRYVALGDSLTAGIGDPVEGGEWRGWAALLGGAPGPARPPLAGPGTERRHDPLPRPETGPDPAQLPGDRGTRRRNNVSNRLQDQGSSGDPDGPGTIEGVRFRNVSVSGALTRDVEERQVPAALDFAPDLASVLVGVNDTLRRAFDIQDLAPRLDRICAALAESGAVLMTACLPDPGAVLGLPAPLARPLARRQRAVNAVVHALSTRYDTVHLHMADESWVADRSLWSADRLHPCERGHRMIAARFHELLAARGLALGPPPSLEADQPSPTRTEALRWLAVSGTGWVVRRCQDLLPELLRLAGDEVQHWARGTGARLDLQADETLSRALATLSPRASVARMGE
ncbi:SGNH/GDSL hydrolase family protein [Streptomyces sp. NPDC088116]|uniref:SGNH/GDSL hydrolase family protein n=1 Tax=Streptomyces sp. NPDC088116 TaxID=3365825 RepID=UPI00381CE41B